jgi:hypothetical protein
MAYEKGFKVTQDFALGIQSVNRAIENNEVLFSSWTSKHSNGIDGVSQPGLGFQFGRHNDILVARSVTHYTVETDTGGGLYLQFDPDVRGALTSTYQPVALGTGQWRIYVQSPNIFGAVATPAATSAAYKATCRAVSSPGGASYVDVSVWNVPSAALAADVGFTLVVWAQEV